MPSDKNLVNVSSKYALNTKAQKNAQPLPSGSDDDHDRPELTGQNKKQQAEYLEYLPSSHNRDEGIDNNSLKLGRLDSGGKRRQTTANDMDKGRAQQNRNIFQDSLGQQEPLSRVKTKNLADNPNNSSRPFRDEGDFGSLNSADDRGAEGGRNGNVDIKRNRNSSGTLPGQGSGAAVVRALRDIAAQKRLMQEHLMELER